VRYLILSDIHSNLAALDACLRHAAGAYDRTLCVGDLVGYGPDPNGVVDWVRQSGALTIRGNHDRACSGSLDLQWFNDYAQTVALWTRGALTPGNIDFLRALPEGPVQVDGFLVAHGSPADEDEYVLSPLEADRAFAVGGHLTSIGHTHLQGGYLRKGASVETIQVTAEPEGRTEFPLAADALYLINPGAVGQPRDHDPRAAYAVYDNEERLVTFCRVSYDIVSVQRRMAAAGLPQPLVRRLGNGC
jgi:diadenosine tetraphosphatase ApaH/serine/threonine PP2A family protein phosphatase